MNWFRVTCMAAIFLLTASFPFSAAEPAKPAAVAAETDAAAPCPGKACKDFPAKCRRWQELTPEEREHARKNWGHFNSLTPQEQKDMRAKHERWQAMSPEKKQRVRQCYQKWSGLSQAEKQKAREACSGSCAR